MKSLHLSFAIPVAVVIGITLPLEADFVPIYGGPTYDSTTGDGYKSAFSSSFAFKGAGLATIPKYFSDINIGTRAMRWDTTGAITEFQVLGTSNGVTQSRIIAANDSGTSVGQVEKFTLFNSVGSRAVRWTPTGAISELGILGTASNGGTTAAAQAANSSGAAAGYAAKYVAGAPVGTFAVRWDVAGAITELGNLGVSGMPGMFSNAVDINDEGTVVGYATKYVAGADRGERAVRWDASSTTATELGMLGTDANAGSGVPNRAFAINNGGVVVGLSQKFVGGVAKGTRAVRWNALSTVPIEMDNLGTDGSGMALGAASGINETGTVIGTVQKYVGGSYKGDRAVRWNAGGTVITELGNLGLTAAGSTTSTARAINASGLVVGFAQKIDAGVFIDERAVVWGTNGAAIDLTTLVDPASGWTSLRHAWDIDDNNWVTGRGPFRP